MMSSDRTLITGASGNLGRQLKKLLPDALKPSHAEMDVTDRGSVFTRIRHGVDSVIHCAALVSVRLCESNRPFAYRVNVLGTKNVFDAFTRFCDGCFVYVSTACVFSGDDANQFYTEDDTPYPKNFYGLTKLLGEHIVAQSEGSLIVRTNFVERGKWKYPRAFTDRFGTYLYAGQVAKEICRLVEKRVAGTVHVCGDTKMSMYELACSTDESVEPMTLKDYRGPALTINMCLTSIRIASIPFEPR